LKLGEWVRVNSAGRRIKMGLNMVDMARSYYQDAKMGDGFAVDPISSSNAHALRFCLNGFSARDGVSNFEISYDSEGEVMTIKGRKD